MCYYYYVFINDLDLLSRVQHQGLITLHTASPPSPAHFMDIVAHKQYKTRFNSINDNNLDPADSQRDFESILVLSPGINSKPALPYYPTDLDLAMDVSLLRHFGWDRIVWLIPYDIDLFSTITSETVVVLLLLLLLFMI